MNNAVMLAKDRPLLTQQAISTFINHSELEWSLTIVDDDSAFQTYKTLDNWSRKSAGIQVIHVAPAVCNTACLRNLGVYWSEKMFPKGEFLYLSDNDAYFTKGWDETLARAFIEAERYNYRLVGPYKHPYHQPHEGKDVLVCVPSQIPPVEVVSTDAVQGIGHLMRWETWDKYGPLVWHQGRGHGANQSEDHWFCQQIVKDGFLVGSIQPNVVYNCGLTGSNGKPSPGAELIEKMAGVYYQ